MTDNIEKIVQEAECVAAADEYFKARTWLMDTSDNRRIFEAGFDRAYALLSKLRAPVADERAAFEAAYAPLFKGGEPANMPRRANGEYVSAQDQIAWMMWQARAALASAPVADERLAAYVRDWATRQGWKSGDAEGPFQYAQRISYAQGMADARPYWVRAYVEQEDFDKAVADAIERVSERVERAALASAPVAGEAVATVMTCYGGEGRFYLDAMCEAGFKPPPGTKLYAAPQASEAVPRPINVTRHSDQSVLLAFSSCREASAYERAALSAQPTKENEK